MLTDLGVKIKLVNRSGNPSPAYETAGAAGMDLRAHLSETLVIKPLARILVPTGLFMEIPEGFEAQVRPRSGLAFKQGITCLNSPGTIDSDYRGEIKVLLINLGQEEVMIRNNDRIAQMIVTPVTRSGFLEVEILEETKRGDGGFGHTGK